LKKPTWVDPLTEQLQKRGEEHEARYVEALRAEGKTLIDLRCVDRNERVARTKEAIAAGADVIIQAALSNDVWSGYADVLMKVAPGRYEAQDTKLARETKGGTILQLCVYTDLLAELQGGVTPEYFRVVTPVQSEPYRFADFGAFYRGIKARFTANLSLRSRISRLTHRRIQSPRITARSAAGPCAAPLSVARTTTSLSSTASVASSAPNSPPRGSPRLPDWPPCPFR
jgi:predicted RecB family nuclease